MTKIGYSRVSTNDQHPEVQSQRLTAAGCERIFTDKGVSGKLASRPQWDACQAYLREGDVLYCVKLDRIGRSVRNLIDVVRDLGERQVDLVVLDQAIDTTTSAGRMMFHVMSAVAEFESDLISERTKAGLAVVKARGRKGGRKPSLSPDQVALAQQLVDAKTHTVAQIAAMVNVSVPTVYRALEKRAKVA
jgi:DNA invertase Pin-like site-specific DNA recombinase